MLFGRRLAPARRETLETCGRPLPTIIRSEVHLHIEAQQSPARPPRLVDWYSRENLRQVERCGGQYPLVRHLAIRGNSSVYRTAVLEADVGVSTGRAAVGKKVKNARSTKSTAAQRAGSEGLKKSCELFLYHLE